MKRDSTNRYGKSPLKAILLSLLIIFICAAAFCGCVSAEETNAFSTVDENDGSFTVDLSILIGGTYQSGQTFVSLATGNDRYGKIVTTNERMKFDGNHEISEIVTALVANNDGSENQWGYKAEAVSGQPTKIKITPMTEDKKLTQDQVNVIFVCGLGGQPEAKKWVDRVVKLVDAIENSDDKAAAIQLARDNYEILPINLKNSFPADKLTKLQEAENKITFSVDLKKLIGETYRAGGTFVSLATGDDKYGKIVTTKDRMTLGGDRNVDEIVTALVANTENQWGYKLVAVEGEPTQVNITPLTDDKKLTPEQVNAIFVIGLGGHDEVKKWADRVAGLVNAIENSKDKAAAIKLARENYDFFILCRPQYENYITAETLAKLQEAEKPVNVTFDSNTGSGTMEKEQFAKYVDQALTANNFTKDGYVFAGWNTEADGSGTSSYTDGESITIDKDTTLYAVWTLKPKEYETGEEVEDDEPTPTAEPTPIVTPTHNQTVTPTTTVKPTVKPTPEPKTVVIVESEVKFEDNKVITSITVPEGSSGSITFTQTEEETMDEWIPESIEDSYSFDLSCDGEINGDSEIHFVMSDTILKSLGLTPEDVCLKHFEDGVWVKLKISYIILDDGTYYYTAVTKSFSPFEISFDAKSEEPTATPTEEQPTKSPMPIVGLLMGLGAALVLRRK